MKVWVTGAGGMVGSHLVEFLYGKGYDVFGTYYKSTINMKEINPAIRLQECDVRYSRKSTDYILLLSNNTTVESDFLTSCLM